MLQKIINIFYPKIAIKMGAGYELTHYYSTFASQ